MSKYQGKVLIVDDNRELLSALKMMLSQHFVEVQTEKNPNLLPTLLRQEQYDLILLDMNFSAGVSTGNEGLYWMHKIHEIDHRITIVFITAYGDVELAVKSMKEGATDFIQKSWDEDKILSTMISAFRLHQSKLEIQTLKNKQKHLSEEMEKDHTVHWCRSDKMKRVYDMIDKVAPTDANILLTGENGTGKEVIAREIHKRSRRKHEIFVNVDLGAVSESLFESELFGHIKGAFTDAKTDRAGRFEIASGGTLFLDEIGNLPMKLQGKLLSTLQNRTIMPVGASKPVPIDVRLISATNQPLFDMVENNHFREDLLYRINTIQIDIPPLRERQEDIPGLANFFTEQYCAKYRKTSLSINQQTMEKMQAYHWPGNIRELQHSIEKAVILSDTDEIQPDFLFPEKITSFKPHQNSFNLEENEKHIIASALEKFRGNISLTAEKLGINRSTLYAKIRKYGLQ